MVMLIALSSCSEDDSSEESTCNMNFDLLVDKNWNPPEIDGDWLAVMRFDSDGKYYEDGEFDGNWEFNDNCNAIRFFVADSGGLEFEYEILSISSDSLRIKGPFGAIVTYHI